MSVSELVYEVGCKVLDWIDERPWALGAVFALTVLMAGWVDGSSPRPLPY